MPDPTLLLFPEDFAEPHNSPPTAPAPAVPAFSEADIAAARAAGHEAGERAGRSTEAAAQRARATELLALIAARLDTAEDAALAAAEARARALARLLLDALGAAFPALCARCGEAEMRRVIAAVMPALTREADVTLRVPAALIDAARDELAVLKLRRAVPLRIEADAGLAAGDVAIVWGDGHAVRDGAATWRDIAEALAPLGLLSAETA